jgi:hypothetical protein
VKRESVMTEHYCQMRLIEDGIRCNQQPPQDDCCNRPAHNYIVIYGEKQWLCPECYDGHMSLRGVLHYDGENLDAQESGSTQRAADGR